MLIYVLCSVITLPHVLCVLPTIIFCWFHVFAQPLPSAVLALQPPQSGSLCPLAFAALPLQTLSVASLKLTASSRPTAPPSGSATCLRFGQWVTLCTLNMHLLTYLLTSFWEVDLVQDEKDQLDSTCVKWKSLESGARTTFSGQCHQATPSKLDRVCLKKQLSSENSARGEDKKEITKRKSKKEDVLMEQYDRKISYEKLKREAVSHHRKWNVP